MQVYYYPTSYFILSQSGSKVVLWPEQPKPKGEERNMNDPGGEGWVTDKKVLMGIIY